jgi:hypothetical protein
MEVAVVVVVHLAVAGMARQALFTLQPLVERLALAVVVVAREVGQAPVGEQAVCMVLALVVVEALHQQQPLVLKVLLFLHTALQAQLEICLYFSKEHMETQQHVRLHSASYSVR